MNNLLKLVTLCLTMVLGPVLSHATTVDQNNPSVGGGFCYTFIGAACGQAFQQSAANISGAGFYVSPDFGSGAQTVTISIFNSYSASPSGLIASGTSGTIDSNSGWVDVFWSPASVSLATEYYMIIESNLSGGSALVAAYSAADYALGTVLYAGSSSSYANYDLTFRTYHSDAVDAVSTPEPASLALLGLGLVGLGLIHRKKA